MECNIDDVLVHGKDETEHDQRLEAVLKRLVEAGVTLNLDKCQFSTDRVKFLGHVISFSGSEADPEKLQAIADLPPPAERARSKDISWHGEPTKQVFRAPC